MVQTEGVSAYTTNIPLAVFGSAKLLAELFERLRQPAIVGEILAGVPIGPGVLGWIYPSPVLTALADLGVLFLLFQVGLEVRAERTDARGPIIGASSDSSRDRAVGVGRGYHHVGGRTAAGGLRCSSIHGRNQRRHHGPASQIILAAAVIDHVPGLIVLAVVSSLARAQVRILELAATAALAIGFTIVIARWGTRTVSFVAPHLVSRLQAGDVRFNLAMVLLFALSVAAADAGIAAIVGAFWQACRWPTLRVTASVI
jgi:Kef-type K+ transport system membrane component KefB